MAHTKLAQPQLIPQNHHWLEKFENRFTDFWGWSLAALSVYLFWVNSPLALIFEDTRYALFESADLLALVLSLAVGVVMTIRAEAKRRRSENVGASRYYLQTAVRYLLVYIFLVYGFAKVFGQQFYSAASTLDTAVGELSGLQLTWRFFGYSYAYTLFVAAAQIISAMLLMFRRTTTLGAVILLPVITNIVIINFTHHIPVKLYSSFYLIMVNFLLFLDFRRLKALFWDNRTFAQPTIQLPPTSKWRRVIKTLIITAFFMATIGENYYANKSDASGIEPTMKGVWEVTEYRVNELPVSDSQAAVWQRVYFDFAFRIAIKTENPKPKYYFSTFDIANRTIRLEEMQSKAVFVEGTYELSTADRMILNLTQGEDRIRVTLHKIS
ncbi:MAG: hypothetical protein AB1757_26020 [Acidobacteriota bacterium]